MSDGKETRMVVTVCPQKVSSLCHISFESCGGEDGRGSGRSDSGGDGSDGGEGDGAVAGAAGNAGNAGTSGDVVNKASLAVACVTHARTEH